MVDLISRPKPVQIDSSDGTRLAARWYEEASVRDATLPVLVLSHPHTKFGGSSGMMDGLARHLAARGFGVLSLDTRGAGNSAGSATWIGWNEVKDISAACVHAARETGARVVVLGSSGAAPFAGSAAAASDDVAACICIGYTCGVLCSLLWRAHYAKFFSSFKPKLFLHGTRDEHTSVSQLRSWIGKDESAARVEVFDGIGHYELEGPRFESEIADKIAAFVRDKVGVASATVGAPS